MSLVYRWVLWAVVVVLTGSLQQSHARGTGIGLKVSTLGLGVDVVKKHQTDISKCKTYGLRPRPKDGVAQDQMNQV